LLVGLTLTIIGFASFFSSFAEKEAGFPKFFWCAFIGLPLLAIGGGLTLFSFRKELTSFAANESKDAIKTVAQATKEGFSDNPKRVCECGTTLDDGDEFCKNCGKPLTVTCPACGAKIDSDSNFCPKCGKNL
jgi:predicted amidophosphoribosyltransferase